MTATRTVLRIAALAGLGAVWLLSASALWATEVPDGLELPPVDPERHFLPGEAERAARHDGFLRIDFLLALAAQLAGLALVAWRAPALVRKLRGPAIVRGLLLGLIAFGAAWLARLPFGLAAHWWERRYDLATRGYLAWLWHRLPGPTELGVLVATLLVAMLLGRWLGTRWWIAAAPVAVAFAAAVLVLQPVFASQRRLKAGPTAELVLAAADGIPVRVERASKRTRRANAEAIGLGPTKRIVVWDTLLDGRVADDAIRFVTAHEVAHHRRRHVLRGLAWFALFAFPCAFVVARVTARRGGPAEPTAIPLVLVAVACLQIASLPIAGAITRRYEAEADWLALEATRDPEGATSLFERFTRVNLADPDPPLWAHLLLSDHPTLLDRIAMTEAWRASRGEALPGGS
jgi:STE24 endopeptidase